MSNAYVARQPIFDRDLEVVGYELLFRDPPVTVANVSDHQAATTRVVLDTLTELGPRSGRRHQARLDQRLARASCSTGS